MDLRLHAYFLARVHALFDASGENAPYEVRTHLKAASNCGCADPGAMQFSDLRSVDCHGWLNRPRNPG